MAIASYSDLSNAIDDYTERSYSEARKDIFIGNAESKFNRKLGSTYRAGETTTLTTDANGEATLPSGSIGLRSLVRDLAGSVPLVATSWDALIEMNPYAESGEPVFYAFNGTTVKVAPIAEADFLATYDARLAALSASNTTNWLLTIAPDIYLTACLAEEKMFTNDYAMADALYARAMQMLDEIIQQDHAAQYALTELSYGVMP